MNGIEPLELDDDFILENDKKLDELLKNYSTMPIVVGAFLCLLKMYKFAHFTKPRD